MQDQTPQQQERSNTFNDIARRLINVASSSNIFGIDTNMQRDLQDSVTQANLQEQREAEARRRREELRIARLDHEARNIWVNHMPPGMRRDLERVNPDTISNRLYAEYSAVCNSHRNQWIQYYIDHTGSQDDETLLTHLTEIYNSLEARLNDLNTIRWNPTYPTNSIPASASSFPPGYAGSSASSSGGAAPRAHMALQSLESRNVSQYFRNLSHY